MVRQITQNFITLIRNFIVLLMGLLFKVEIFQTLGVRVDSLFMEGHLLTKISQERIPVQGCCQWQIVAEIRTHRNFLSP